MSGSARVQQVTSFPVALSTYFVIVNNDNARATVLHVVATATRNH